MAARAKAEGKATLGIAELDDIAAARRLPFDPVNGGIRGAPKFPQCGMLEFLGGPASAPGTSGISPPSTLTLDRMSEGGIYDHLGGGFSRYSVDEHWLVPHFEKMLYDNAQLLELLALAHARTGHLLFRERAQKPSNGSRTR